MNTEEDAAATVLGLDHQAGVDLIVRQDGDALLVSVRQPDYGVPSHCCHSFLLSG